MKTIKPLQGEDELLVSDTDPLSSPNSEAEFIRPAYNFCGRELHPYTQGSDIVFRQLCHFNDNGLTKALKFIFVHVKRDGADMQSDLQAHVIPLAWATSEEIHVELIGWASANIRSDADKSEALRLYSEITTAANNAAVEIVGTDEGKKKNATKPSRTRRRSLVERFAGKFTEKQILWELPLARLNQLVHVQMFRSGHHCRGPQQLLGNQRMMEGVDLICASIAAHSAR